MGGVTEAQGGGLRGGAGRNHAPLAGDSGTLVFFFIFLAGNDLPPLQIQFHVWWSVYKLLFRGSS